MPLPNISRLDFGIFSLTLVVPILIGIYFALVRKHKNNHDYLLGSRSLSAIPMSFSLAASFLTTSIVTGVPGEVAYYGTVGPGTTILSALAGSLIVILMVPIFYKMKLNSVYEYLELRYRSRMIRQMGSLTFIVSMTIHLAFVLYLPSEALKDITGLPSYAFIILIGMVATLYTMMGGIQSLMWCDVFQCIIVGSSLLTIGIQSVQMVGGLEEVWQMGLESGRLQWAHFDPSPFTRSSSWIILLGHTVIWAARLGCHQSQVQKYCSVMSLSQARWTLFLATLFFCLIQGTSILAGLAIYANIWDCDPLAQEIIDSPSGLIANFVINHLGTWPGVLGLLMASMIASTLGTLTAGVHSLSSVLWEDLLFQCPQFQSTNDKQQLEITRSIGAIMGTLIVGLSLTTLYRETILEIGIAAIGTLAGPMLAIFLLGFFTATTNKFGCFCGLLLGNAVTIWMFVGSIVWEAEITHSQASSTSFNLLDTFTLGCEASNGSGLHFQEAFARHESEEGEFFYIPPGSWESVLYSTNQALYPFIGFLICLITSLTVSLLTHLCLKQKPVEQLLLHPWARFKEDKETGGSLLLKQTQRHYITHNLPHKGLYNEAWQIDDHLDTHYRWPSPSLPPTLKKNKGHHANGASNAKNGGPLHPYTLRDPSSEGEMSHQSVATSKEEFSNTPTTMSSIHGYAPHKTFSRQHVIHACEAAAAAESHDEDDQSSAQTSANDEILSCSSSTVELDEFGDVIPTHLRKPRAKKDLETSPGPSGIEKSPTQPKKEETEEDGWTTDF